MSNFYFHTSKNLEILENNTEFINLLNKIGDSYRIPVNNDYFDSYEYFIHRIKSVLDDVCFDKTIENHNDTIKARIFYDMPENIIWLERSYRQRRSSIDDFVKELPVPFEEWISMAKEVLEEPEILEIFVNLIDSLNPLKEITIGDITYKLDELHEEIKNLLENGNKGDILSLNYDSFNFS